MLGKNVGFYTKVKSLNSGPITFTHCIIHREALAAKKISAELCIVLHDAVRIINYNTSCALDSPLFSNLCKQMDSDFSSLLLQRLRSKMAVRRQSFKKTDCVNPLATKLKFLMKKIFFA